MCVLLDPAVSIERTDSVSGRAVQITPKTSRKLSTTTVSSFYFVSKCRYKHFNTFFINQLLEKEADILFLYCDARRPHKLQVKSRLKP